MSFPWKLSLKLALVALLALAPMAACDGSDTDATDPTNEPGTTPGDPNDPGVVVDPGPTVTPTDPEFAKTYAAVVESSKAMTLPSFLAKYLPKSAPGPLALSYDPMASTYFAAIDAALGLNPAEKAKIGANGFVVSERLTYPTMADALLDVYAKDLPILVTSDMIF